MTVTLTAAYKTKAFITQLNKELVDHFGATDLNIFTTKEMAKQELDYYNNDTEGQTFLTHLPRPMTLHQLLQHAFWLKIGAFSYNIATSQIPLDEALTIIAVTKWIVATNAAFISAKTSKHYQPGTIHDYVDDVLTENNLNPDDIWRMP